MTLDGLHYEWAREPADGKADQNEDQDRLSHLS